MRYIWSIIFALAATRYLAFIARMNVVPFYPEFMERFGISYTGAGALFSAFFIGYIGSLVPAGIAADRWPLRSILIAGVSLLGAAGLIVTFTDSYGLVIVARVAQGIAVALTFAAALKAVAVRFSRQWRGKAVGIMEVATGAGQLTALSLFPALQRTVHYQPMLLSLPVLCLLTLIPLVFTRQIDDNQASDPKTADDSEKLVDDSSSPGPLLNWNIFFVTATNFLGLLILNGILSWLPTHLSLSLGYSPAAAGLIMAVILLSQVSGVYPAGHLSDRIGRRLPVVNLGSTLFVIGLLVLIFAGPGIPIFIAAAILGIGAACSMAPLVVLITEMSDPRRAGLVGSITVAASQAGSGLAGVAFGWILDKTGTFTLVWLLAAVLAVIRLGTAALVNEKGAAEARTSP